MEKSLPGQQNYFEAFIKAAQYFAGLTAQQDIWSETGKVLVNFFGAEVGAVEEKRANAETAGHRWVFSERYSNRTDLVAETREAIAEVLESGFLSVRIILTPDPLSIACFPITRQNQVVAAMVVGHAMLEPLPREQLDVYLAVAGLVGSTVGRLASERELRRHRLQLEAEITERKLAELALSRLTETLERQVAERTGLAETRAKQLQALAMELIETEERERRKFARLLHDDLQQMLAAAKMQLQSLSDNMPNKPELVDILLLLKESIEKTRSLSHELSPPVLQHSGLIRALEWLGLRMGKQFDLKVEFEVAKEPRIANSIMKSFLFRSVQELLFNTVKHAGVKSAKVVVSSTKDSVTVTVSDQGQGFVPQVIQESTGKVGFGLLTIKVRAGNIGGKFAIESAPGQGSRFTLTVPNTAISASELEKISEPVVDELSTPRTRTTETSVGNVRALFVDDHRVMRQGLIGLVKGQSAIHVVGEAANGQGAIDHARKLEPDVIVMDISMPVMDGIEATRCIKAALPKVRVIGLTMYDDVQVIGAMQQAGAEVTLSKTTSAAELIKAIYGRQ